MHRFSVQRFHSQPSKRSGGDPIIEAPHLRRQREPERLPPTDAPVSSGVDERYCHAGLAPRRHRRHSMQRGGPLSVDGTAEELPVLFGLWHAMPGQDGAGGFDEPPDGG